MKIRYKKKDPYIIYNKIVEYFYNTKSVVLHVKFYVNIFLYKYVDFEKKKALLRIVTYFTKKIHKFYVYLT